MGEFLMPSLGADMAEGTVVEWQVAPGDRVQKGGIVAIVATDKADIDVEVFEDGVIEELLVPVGDCVAVGTPLARLDGGVAPAEVATATGDRPSHVALEARDPPLLRRDGHRHVACARVDRRREP